MARVVIIGGTGAELFTAPGAVTNPAVANRYGEPSAGFRCWEEAGHELMFLARHGDTHGIPPHAVNYRANLAAIREQGADVVLGLNAVGGIATRMIPGRLVIPHQFIDYSWGREHSFESTEGDSVQHVDVSSPFSSALRNHLVRAAQRLGYHFVAAGVYGVTQGPRLETPAEIDRMEQDGCDV
ncbi:MAG: MTAP family purine nucleoside phosphorylase, partial [Gammaproteobacteria bacterium]